MNSSFAAAAAAGVVLLVAAGTAANPVAGPDRPTAAPRMSTATSAPDPAPESSRPWATPSSATPSATAPSKGARPSTATPAAPENGRTDASRPESVAQLSRRQSTPATGTTAAKPAAAPRAVPPANDASRGAVLIPGLPTTAALDVAGATLDRLEAGLAADCGSPTTDRAVWFRYDDPAGLGFVADASGSDHPVRLALLGGDPRNNVLMGCSAGPVLTASAGPTGPFHVAVLSDARQAASRLQVRFRAIDAAPDGTVTLDADGRLSSGKAVLTGTYSCTGGSAVSASVSAEAAQGAATGIAAPAEVVCDGAVHPWTLVVSGPADFERGTVAAAATISTCRRTAGSRRGAGASVVLGAET